jgi:hypothetical protein
LHLFTTLPASIVAKAREAFDAANVIDACAFKRTASIAQSLRRHVKPSTWKYGIGILQSAGCFDRCEGT